MRATIVKLLKEVATKHNINVDLRPGSPMYIYLVDLLASTLPALLEDIAAAGTMNTQERADNFYVTEGEAQTSEFTVRLYFYSPTTLQYPVNQMIFSQGGVTYSNKYPVTWPASNMAFYTDGVNFFYDVDLEGDAPISSSASLVMQAPPTNFSHVVISSVTAAGSTAFSETQLETAIIRELSLRNNVTRPGIIAYLSNLYGAALRDVLVQGFLDPEQNRDVYNNIHMGGYVDTYVKGSVPTTKLLKFDNAVDEDVKITGGYTVCAPGASILPHINLVTFALQKWVRSGVDFTINTDYTVGMATGIVTLLGFVAGQKHTQIPVHNFMSGDFAGTDIPGGFPGGITDRTVTLIDPVDDYIKPGHIIQGIDSGGVDLGYYIVRSVNIDPAVNSFTVDRNIIKVSLYYLRYLEPVRCVYDYNPIGVPLEDFENPVLSLDNVNVLDPLTDEETEIEILPMPGFGSGNFGAGGFGIGENFGYFLHSFDELLRYSMRETGFLELPRQYETERIGVNYHTDALIPLAHVNLLENRARPADVLAFAFTPVITDLDIRIAAPSEISEAAIIDMIWGMPGRIELSDIIDGFYNLGATYVNIGDLFTASKYTLWTKDGILTRIMPTTDGVIALSGLSERFLPRSVTMRYE